MENPQTVDIALQKFDSLVKELKKYLRMQFDQGASAALQYHAEG